MTATKQSTLRGLTTKSKIITGRAPSGAGKTSSGGSIVKMDDPIGTATVTCGALNVRQGPGTNYARIGGLTKGKTVSVYADEGEWIKIGYGTGFGYVCQKYTTYQDAATTTQDPENPPSQQPEPENPPETPSEPENTTQTGKVVNVTSYLNVRDGAGTDCSIIGSLGPGETVTIIEKVGNWYKIEYNGGVGYVNADYIEITSSDPTTIPETPSEDPSSSSSFEVYITASVLNVRSGPGTSYGKIGSLSQGSQVTVLEEKDGWYRIEYEGKEGWISAEYCTKIGSGDGTPGGVTSNGTIDYKQYDSRWASLPFTSIGDSSQTYKSSGCGPTAAADVVWSMRNNSVTPVTLGTMCVDNGYRSAHNGTDNDFFPFVGAKYGMSCTHTYDMSTLKSKLADGALAVARMGAGYWTTGGHFICVYKYDGSTVYANDPGSSNRKSQNGSDFKKEMKDIWCYK
ncbi:MAG: SH3 domain-containing protein [Proteobacteria bacterium]|nr:SH3 domain-containing protein [Pseudomonadota bacterium]